MNYDRFAPFYDATMGDRSDVINLLSEQINRYTPRASSILELGCGTGSILAGFPNFKRTGVDISPEMLQIAQQKLPFVDFEQGDISHFSLNKKFDAIICVFDTINHLSGIGKWASLFASTAEHINDNGLFIFDMNTVGRVKALTAMPTYTQQVNGLTVDMDITPAGSDAVDWHITVQEPQADGTIQVHEDTARERSYPLSTVKTKLDEAGFSLIASFDSDRHPATDNSDRVYFVCQLKKSAQASSER